MATYVAGGEPSSSAQFLTTSFPLSLPSSPFLVRSFYTDEDVRSRSVCEVTSHLAVDPLGTALPNGVYDPRLGPSSADAPPCVTCAQRYAFCPGHFGHIELCVPLYHPLLFGRIVEMLRMKCLNCHRLTAPARALAVYRTKFMLLQHGEHGQVQELDNRMAAHMKRARGDDDGADDGGGAKKRGNNRPEKAISLHNAGAAVDELLAEIQNSLLLRPPPGPGDSSAGRRSSESAFEEAYKRDLVKEAVSACKGAKFCPHCGAYSPRIRKDMGNKIFQSPLSATAKRMNAAEGIHLKPALTARPNRLGADDDGDEDETRGGYDSDDSDNRITAKAIGVKVDDDDGDGDGATNDDGDGLDNDVVDTQYAKKDNYMHPSEVQAQVQRTWETNPELCNSLFAVQGPAIFFLQAIPVPPNRFRPAMHLGNMIVEHAQNGFLNKILEANDQVRTNFASGNESVAYKLWIELQTHLNCYMDNSTDPAGVNQNTPMGIRQLLERKEGIFRKHMMGKRVNFACRSVISPDPYIGTNEIGLPQVFAETLTYPTPVTDINIGEMRRLVERGAFNYPGARWVEFPDRRVDLSKMDDHKREAIAAQLLTYAKKGGKPAIVGRQLQDGDMVLMNRQVRSSLVVKCVHSSIVWGYLVQGGANLSCTTLKKQLIDYDHFHRRMSSRDVAQTVVPRIYPQLFQPISQLTKPAPFNFSLTHRLYLVLLNLAYASQTRHHGSCC